MSTRGNVVFVSRWTIEELEKYFVIDYPKALTTKGEESEVLKNCYKIYIHSDMYPSGALPDLQEFLQMTGAKHRAQDTSYLSAWFVGWKCMDMLPYTRRMEDGKSHYQECTNPSLEDMKKSDDFFGVGLLNELSDWADYTYVIVPNTEEAHKKAETECHKNYYRCTDENSFDIYIFSGALDKFLAKVNSEDNLGIYEDEDWWY